MKLRIIIACVCVMTACLAASMGQDRQSNSPGNPSIERGYDRGTAYMMDAFPSPNLVKVKLRLTIPFDMFSLIANGKEVELKIGPTEIKLTERDIAVLRTFASPVREEAKEDKTK